MQIQRPMRNYETIEIESGGQDVIVTWFPAHDEPYGTGHGSAEVFSACAPDVFAPLHHRALIAANVLDV